MKRGLWLGVLGALVLAAPTARAHELACEKKVKVVSGNDVPVLSAPGGMNGIGGSDYASIDSYPATVKWKLKVLNVHDTSPSVVLGAEDPLLEKLGFSFDPATPFTLPHMGTETDYFEHTIESYEDCLRIAKKDGYEDRFIDNVFTVTWDDDNASCSARVECKPPENGDGGATRTIGYWSTHPDAMAACLGSPIDPIDLGVVTVDSLADAFGILWGNTAFFPPGPPSGERRSNLDQTRFILLSQLLGAICNERVFGTTPTPSSLIADAIAAVEGTDCQDITAIKDALDAFNNSGDEEPFPPGVSFGPADPQTARDLAADPTTPSGQVCQ